MLCLEAAGKIIAVTSGIFTLHLGLFLKYRLSSA
jgi:hypothetical protein